MIYPWPGDIAPNVPKFRYDPPELANAWQKIQSVHSPIYLDRKSITCVARDLLSINYSQNTPVSYIHWLANKEKKTVLAPVVPTGDDNSPIQLTSSEERSSLRHVLVSPPPPSHELVQE